MLKTIDVWTAPLFLLLSIIWTLLMIDYAYSDEK